ncbi:MAG TPA: MerR family transcriptional regulator [Solirubrobacteraceae bacterium]|nr:MerR family transcriptional regulator [Solirubrobacteraceae bacterium]
MSTIANDSDAATAGGAEARAQSGPGGRTLRIGAVCKTLAQEFPDLSISKIRYLEEQKLISPRRTPGGYRLYSTSDVERLRTILRLQRDEFLPLRVIRQELAAGRGGELPEGSARSDGRRILRASIDPKDAAGPLFSLQSVTEETQVDQALVEELVEYGIIKGTVRSGRRYFDETEREIVRAVAELARFGVGGRNLRLFRSSADREASLLEQILAPALRSRNSERRREALETLENLAAVTARLKHLLLIADLRRSLA